MHERVLLTQLINSFVVWMLVFVTVGCGSSVATSTGPSPTKCPITLAVPATPVASSGATATVELTTQPECVWSASSDASWISAVTPSSGQGSAQLQLQVDANPDASVRQSEIVVNGERVRIRQDAAPCRFEVSATEQNVPPGGGSGGITVTAASGCAWTAQVDAAWVVLTSGTSSSGPGTLNFTVASNAGTTTRTATISVANQTVKITQRGNPPPAPTLPIPTPTPTPVPTPCTVVVAPKEASFPASGTNSNSVSVSATSACNWTATSNAPWISITAGSSGTGNGTVTFSVAANSGAARSSSIKVGDQTVGVIQAPLVCTYTVSPLATSVTGAGGPGTPIVVDTPMGCPWTASSNTTWLSIVSGATGTSRGSVAFSASANTGAARTGSLTVAGQTVSVAQACLFTVTPSTISFPASGTIGTSVTLTTVPTCAWTAISNASWISITSGPGGIDSATVTFTVAANSGAARMGTLTVGGQTVTVNQAAP